MLEPCGRNVFGVPQIVKFESKTVLPNLEGPVSTDVDKRGDFAFAYASFQDSNPIRGFCESVNVLEDMIYSDFLGIIEVKRIIGLTIITSIRIQL